MNQGRTQWASAAPSCYLGNILLIKILLMERKQHWYFVFNAAHLLEQLSTYTMMWDEVKIGEGGINRRIVWDYFHPGFKSVKINHQAITSLRMTQDISAIL